MLWEKLSNPLTELVMIYLVPSQLLGMPVREFTKLVIFAAKRAHVKISIHAN
jgi:hypothetical protein